MLPPQFPIAANRESRVESYCCRFVMCARGVDVQTIRNGYLERRTTVRRSHTDRSELIAYVVVRDTVTPGLIVGGVV